LIVLRFSHHAAQTILGHRILVTIA